MEGLFLLKETLQEGDYMCKIDFKDAYFSVPLNLKSQKFLIFKSALPVPLPLLWFGTSPKDIHKVDESSLSLLRKLYVRLIIFLDDILLMVSSKEELALVRDTLIYLLQNLGFLINRKKSVLEPCQNIQFLGMEFNSTKMTLTLPQEKEGKIVGI